MKFSQYLSAFSAGSVALLAFAGNASAVTLELGLAIDGSGSISSSDFALQIDGYVDAFSDPNFFSTVVEPSPFDDIAVGVYQFATGVTEEIAFTTISSQADADALATLIGSITQADGATNFVDTVNTITSDIFSNAIDSDRQVIDFSTDGVPTTGGGQTDSIAAADAARANGIDAINSLGVGGGADISFLEAFSDADNVDPDDNTGFVIAVDSFDEFAPAVADKLVAEITEPPEEIPFEAEGTMGLVALGGFFWYRKRQQQKRSADV